MKSLLIVAVALFAAVASGTPHMDTIFSITLPITPAKQAANVVSGDNFYVATKTGITAVDLSTKTIPWNANVSGDLQKIYRHGDKVVAFVYPFDVVGLDATTGDQVWKTSIFDLDPLLNFTARGDELAMVAPEKVTILNASTGDIVRHTKCDSLHVSSWGSGPAFGAVSLTRALPTQSADPVVYCLSGGTIKAISLFSGNQIWASSVAVKNLDYVFEGQYVVLSNGSTSSETSDLTVLDTLNGNVKVEVSGISGVLSSTVYPTLKNNTLSVIAGSLFFPLKITVDLTTGLITNSTAYKGSSLGSGFKVLAEDIASEIQVTQDLHINVQPVGEAAVQVAPFVPSAAAFNLQYYGAGVFQVGNKQGWTMWQLNGLNPATVIATNEVSPNWTPSVAEYEGAYLFVTGNTVKAEKWVQ